MKLTARQAADRLGVSVRTLDRYVAAGLITPLRATPTAHRKFDTEAVDALLDEHGNPPEPTELPNP